MQSSSDSEGLPLTKFSILLPHTIVQTSPSLKNQQKGRTEGNASGVCRTTIWLNTIPARCQEMEEISQHTPP